MEAFTWDNLMRLKNGDALEKRLFRAIVIVWIMLLIFIADWVISWLAGGYLTTASAIVSFFIHFFGFYSLWGRSRSGMLWYFLLLVVLSLLYVANDVLIILTLVLNTSSVSLGGTTIEDNAPITPIVFQLNGIAGNDAAAAVLYYLMIALNVVVNMLTIYHCWLVYTARRMLGKKKRASSWTAPKRASPPSSSPPPELAYPEVRPPLPMHVNDTERSSLTDARSAAHGDDDDDDRMSDPPSPVSPMPLPH